MRLSAGVLTCAAWMALTGTACAAEPAATSPDAAMTTRPGARQPSALEAAAMGDWDVRTPDGKELTAQVIAWGVGKYQMNLLARYATPIREDAIAVLEGKEEGNEINFAGKGYTAKLVGNNLTLLKEGGPVPMPFMKSERKSPTLGAKAPEGAVVLLDGTNLDQWQKVDGKPAEWKLVEGGAMEIVKSGNIESKKGFGDAKYHIEFRTPFMPDERGQKRGNSGVYIQGAYEIQVLDSYGLEGVDNECGGIYKVSKPRVNMCAAPLTWQTYDITFHAAKFDETGKKIQNAKISIDHNGVSIHSDLELPNATAGGKYKEDPKGPAGLFLQDHGGDPVQYRNIWVQELSEKK